MKGIEEYLSLNNSVILYARVTLQIDFSVAISIKSERPSRVIYSQGRSFKNVGIEMAVCAQRFFKSETEETNWAVAHINTALPEEPSTSSTCAVRTHGAKIDLEKGKCQRRDFTHAHTREKLLCGSRCPRAFTY